jgi:hypothetical protein
VVSAAKQRVIASSETGLWGNLISTPLPSVVPNLLMILRPPLLIIGKFVGIPFTCCSASILEFSFDRNSLAVIPRPMGLDKRAKSLLLVTSVTDRA